MAQLVFSIEEARAAVGCGRTTIYKLINSGDLKARKIGKRTLILKDDLEAFLCGLEAYAATNNGEA